MIFSTMDHSPITLLTATSYLLISVYQFWLLKKHDGSHIKRVAALSIVPLLLHGYLLHGMIDTDSGQDLSMQNLYSMVFWVISIALVISSQFKKLDILLMAVFPLSALIVVIASLSQNTYILDASSMGYLVHINLAIAALSIIALAAIQSVFVTILDNRLKQRPLKTNLALPALQDMEKFLYFLIALGFILLTLTIVTAILYMPSTGTGASTSLHKPILSIASWLVLGGFLIGRYRNGWRAKTAAHWTITAFVLLFLAYFGTRTILQFIMA